MSSVDFAYVSCCLPAGAALCRTDRRRRPQLEQNRKAEYANEAFRPWATILKEHGVSGVSDGPEESKFPWDDVLE